MIALLLLVFASPSVRAQPQYPPDDELQAPVDSSDPIQWSILGGGYHLQLLMAGAIANPSVYGGELSAAALMRPAPGRGWFIGPRFGFFAATGSGTTRFDVNTGVETSLWIANAIGPGLAAVVAAPSTDGVHFRVEALLNFRLQHFRRVGAWAARLGLNYDNKFQWGMQAGITLQFTGVPQIGEE